MEEDIEETTPLNLTVATTQNDNQVELLLNLRSTIQTINRIGPSGNTALSFATIHEHDNTQVLLPNDTLQLLSNTSHSQAHYDISQMNELYRQFLQSRDLFHSDQGSLDDDDCIEWSFVGDNLIRKHRELNVC